MPTYSDLRRLVANEPCPAFWVDLDALDRNLDRVVKAARHAGKKIRLATKSVRVPHLIQYLRDKSGGTISGLMCYSAAEAEFLAKEGHDDLLVAYPVATLGEIQKLGAL